MSDWREDVEARMEPVRLTLRAAGLNGTLTDIERLVARLEARLEGLERERDEAIRQRDLDYARFSQAKQAILERDIAAAAPRAEGER